MLYFFNLAGAVYDPDNVGTDLASLADARQEAVKDLAEYVRDNPAIVWAGQELRMEVTDEERALLCTVILFGLDAPAAGGVSLGR